MKIVVTSIPVDDQATALEFYTKKLGFQVKHDIPMGDHRWLTVVDPESPDGVELLLEPIGTPEIAAELKAYRTALVANGIPWTSMGSTEIESEVAALTERGVTFVQPLMDAGPVKLAVFDDTCGNLIQVAQSRDER